MALSRLSPQWTYRAAAPRRVSASPYHDGKVHVCAELCATCVFRPGNLMRLESGRLSRMIHDALRGDTAIICHSTLYQQTQQEAVCRGFFDRHKRDTLPLRLALMLDTIAYV